MLSPIVGIAVKIFLYSNIYYALSEVKSVDVKTKMCYTVSVAGSIYDRNFNNLILCSEVPEMYFQENKS